MNQSYPDDSKIRQYVGDRIKSFRLAKNLSQEELAKAIGYDSQMGIAHLETGERSIKVEMLAKIAGALNVQIDDFFPNPKTQEKRFAGSIKLRASKIDKEVEQSIRSFAEAARARFANKQS